MKRLLAILAVIALCCAALLYASDYWNGFTLTASCPSAQVGRVTLAYPALASGEGAVVDGVVFFSNGTSKDLDGSVSGPCSAGTLTIAKGSGSPSIVATEVSATAWCTKGGQNHTLHDEYYP